MELEWVESTDDDKLKVWDQFNMSSPRGHYCQLSSWLRSFAAYGFDFSVLLMREAMSGPVKGGMGVLHFGRRSFSVVTSPIGPILDVGFEHASEAIIEAALQRISAEGAFLLQLQLPCSPGVSIPALLSDCKLPSGLRPHEGMAFPTGNAPNQMLWVDFPEGLEGDAWRDHMLNRFSKNTRRDIRRADRNSLDVIEVRTEHELRQAYSLVEANGREHGYATRTWKDFGKTLIDQVRSGHAIILLARHNGEDMGVHYGVLAGRRYSYVMGGTKRTEEDLLVGHFLHWRAINKAKELGMLGYDLTSGGTAGVTRFKKGFRPSLIRFVPPVYVILSRWRFAAFNWTYPVLRKHKRLASSILSSTTNLLRRKLV